MDQKRQIRIKDIAQRANVSIGTVDRVLHNRGEVSEETRETVMRIIKELDYHPNVMARALASKKKLLFATLLPTPLSREGYWTKPAAGIKKRITELRQFGISHESFTYSQNHPLDFVAKAEQILSLHPDGVVLAPFFSRESLLFIARLKEGNVPFVFIDSNIPDQGQLAYFGQNSYRCGMLSARLLSLLTPGRGSLLILHYAKEMEHQNHLVQREMGFYEWYRKNQPDRQVRTFEISIDDLNASHVKLKELYEEYRPEGIFVTSSKVYLAARTIGEYGLHNIRLIGHDLLPENKKFLTVGIVDFLICQRPEEQGYDAVNALFQGVVHKLPVREYNYAPIEIITRENLEFYHEFK
ncbi:MAG: HTH-type transcriptional regulator DegA [Bacteroidetes bacterium ADurb.Bin123]|nr:MAG: HTH-type transcriptional regulator DegA [Bacteroidetes bacterium ADurb.Bin123]